jgi:hypothetical protein
MKKVHSSYEAGLIARLQSRIAKRRGYLAYLEEIASSNTRTIKALTNVLAEGTAEFPEIIADTRTGKYIERKNIRTQIKIIANDQKLDNELLRTLYGRLSLIRFFA